MAREVVQNITKNLPWRLKENIEGYVDAVEAALPEITRASGTKLSPKQREVYLLLVAVRRLWAAINGQYWVMSDSVGIMERAQLSGFKIGSDYVSRDSQPFRESQMLRRDFEVVIARLGIEGFVTGSTSLAELAKLVAVSQ